MKILTVVGARPQFVKAALVSEACRSVGGLTEVMVHTGQHYDHNMSAVFFDQLALAEPRYNLGIGSGPHGRQTGEMMAGLETIVAAERPTWLLVYGDTNSTVAGALVAAKQHVPLAHVEAGLRSFNRRMPEEVNRVVTDVLSALLLCPTTTAVDNLAREGMSRGVHQVGDVMLDMVRRVRPRAAATRACDRLQVVPGEYYVVTVHRAENTNDPVRLEGILRALERLDAPAVFPAHPRTRRALEALGWQPPREADVRLLEPLGYLEMVELVANARAVLTDSGGLQKEAYFLGRPCVTLRDETEWIETLHGGWNVLAGTATDRILEALTRPPYAPDPPQVFGDGCAALKIAELLARGPETSG
ncbi:MAG TPA: UDP-N-acetylglucosamine 2-epimerase (non-hydrolyzing) [Gemmatimonadales bacterium]|nr:UDP-N-acetylglucosamine 2-epimerase (non-hydrolyzing) [Gemmatimonadales bacterium]